MRDSGKATKDSILSAIKDIDDYTRIVKQELTCIMAEAEALSDVWKDDKYNRFIEHLDKLRLSVENELSMLEYTRIQLKEKADLM